MKERGYRLRLFYLWLPTVDMAIARVAHRVEQGGHNVPEAVIRRRFDIGPRNLLRFYLPLFDLWMLFDSSTVHPREIASYDGKKIDVVDAELYGHILIATKEHRP